MVIEIKALEINATLAENEFRMKEMNAKKRVTSQNKSINATSTKNQNLLRQRQQG